MAFVVNPNEGPFNQLVARVLLGEVSYENLEAEYERMIKEAKPIPVAQGLDDPNVPLSSVTRETYDRIKAELESQSA